MLPPDTSFRVLKIQCQITDQTVGGLARIPVQGRGLLLNPALSLNGLSHGILNYFRLTIDKITSKLKDT